MDSFRIELNSTNGVLFPGQLVNGRVIVHLREAIKARAIVVHVVGKAKTSWTVWETREASQPGSGGVHVQRHTHSESVPYSSEEMYIDTQVNIWHPTGGEGQQLTEGVHDFPFVFTLPNHCAPSFEGTIGFIRYYCKAKIDRPWKFDDTTKCSFTVMPNFDLNTIYHAGLPAIKEFSKNIGLLCFKHGRIAGTARLVKSGYVPGEPVTLCVEITNSTASKDVSRVECSLVEIATYTARRNSRLLDTTSHTIRRHKEVEKKQEQRTVIQFNEQFKVQPGCQGTYQRLLTIPPVVPSFNSCPIITVDYKFKIKVTAKGALSNSVSAEMPILIGTIPIRRNFIQPQEGRFIPSEHYLAPPQPSAPPDTDYFNGSQPTFNDQESGNNIPSGPPPSYAESVFGRGTGKGTPASYNSTPASVLVPDNADEKNDGFAPRYIYYNNF